MAYRDDNDLDFLATADDDDLKILMDYLIRDKDGNLRLTEELTSNPNYKANPNHPSAFWKDIAAELQCYGANTLVTMLRGGKGVQYREILCDVCDKMNVNYNSKSSLELIEMNLLQKILIDSIEEMDNEQMKALINSLDINVNHLTKQAVIAAIQGLILKGGFAPFKLAVIVANAVAKALLGRGVAVAGNAALTKAIAVFAGPIGWALNGLWIAVDVAGPAYRVTVPAVVQIAYMRAKSYTNTNLSAK